MEGCWQRSIGNLGCTVSGGSFDPLHKYDKCEPVFFLPVLSPALCPSPSQFLVLRRSLTRPSFRMLPSRFLAHVALSLVFALSASAEMDNVALVNR